MIEFKNDKARETYQNIDDRLKCAVYECSKWCEERKLPFIVTRAIDDMIPNVSKTNIHADGRAIDISVIHWTTDDIDDFVYDMNELFSDSIGAYSLTDKKPRFVVYHNAGAGWHCHLQVRK